MPWKTAIQVNFEVTGTMPSQQEMRGTFSKRIMLSEPDFKFAHQIIHERTFRSQITTDLSDTGDSQRDSRESIRANHSQLTPLFL